MTVAKFKVVLRKDKVSKHGEAPVCLRITKDRRCTYKTLFHLNPAYWDENAQRVKNNVLMRNYLMQRLLRNGQKWNRRPIC